MRSLLCALAALLVVTAAQAAPNHERVVLPNGLVVIALQDTSSAIGAFHLGVQVNPADLPAGSRGLMALSQQVAHAALKQRLAEPPYQALNEELQTTRAALTLNTEMDYLEARGQMPAGTLPVALELTGKVLFGAPPPTPPEVTAAKDTLANAISDRAENVVESTYYRFLQAHLGKRHALAQPPEGTAEALGALSAADLEAFRTAVIGPNNASLCVIGPQSTTDLLAMVRMAFAAYSPARTKGQASAPPPLPAEAKISVGQLPRWRGCSLMIGAGTPPYGTPGFLRAQLLYTLLDGEQGRLRQDPDLRSGLGLNRLMSRGDDQPTVTVLAPMAMPRPFLIMHMMTVPRLMEPAREVLLGHLLALATKPPSAAELIGAKKRLINAYAMMQLSRLNFAKSLNCYELYGQDYQQAWGAMDQIAATTGEDLLTTAKECFGVHSIGLVMPGDEEEE